MLKLSGIKQLPSLEANGNVDDFIEENFLAKLNTK